ncbi:hypothetical protein Mnod_7631 [Methylobacterium nodulans ORS 2060]|uniref:Uncharacterized protein n=2 Tax=Methylobacterium nodulans TaxID=114616 RepID=B8IQR9_METNO|nr:hypothetical protein Mnod_7631 [Methylobacterium nodulans ORS 2060]
MKLWLLTLIDNDALRASAPVVTGFVVRAEDETAARKLAAVFAESEGRAAWHDPTVTKCEELTADGPAQVVLLDFRAGS